MAVATDKKSDFKISVAFKTVLREKSLKYKILTVVQVIVQANFIIAIIFYDGHLFNGNQRPTQLIDWPGACSWLLFFYLTIALIFLYRDLWIAQGIYRIQQDYPEFYQNNKALYCSQNFFFRRCSPPMNKLRDDSSIPAEVRRIHQKANNLLKWFKPFMLLLIITIFAISIWCNGGL